MSSLVAAILTRHR